MKSQHAGSLFGMLVIASSFALLNLAGLEIPYLKGHSAYAVTRSTLEQSVSSPTTAESAPHFIYLARRIGGTSR